MRLKYQSSGLIIFLFLFLGQGLLICYPDWPQMYYIVQAGLELAILLPQRLKYQASVNI